MRPFWKCLIIKKTLVRTKLKFYSFWKNLCLIFIFGSVGPKSKNPNKFTFLNFLILNETILEMPYCQLNFGKNRLEILALGGGFEADFHIWAHWPRIKKKSLNPMFLKYKGFFVKFLICAYWAKKVIVLTIWFSMLVTVFTISLDFQNRYIFFKTLFARTFYHAVCNISYIRDYNF